MVQDEAKRLGVPQRKPDATEIVERCLYAMINEGALLLEEGIALRASDIDVVYTAGYGFPRYRGGPMFYAETIGLKTLLDGINKYRAEFGPMHWEPAPLLVKLVQEGKSLADWSRSQ
ncbi:MAG TPA: 3-hydroxyacyl-CoA dehydrogenase family protein, partial [Ktedonobacterales bacterium]